MADIVEVQLAGNIPDLVNGGPVPAGCYMAEMVMPALWLYEGDFY